MTTDLRLLRIEVRRNIGLLMFIPFAAMVWGVVMFTTPTASGKLVLWSHVIEAVRGSTGAVGAALGAAVVLGQASVNATWGGPRFAPLAIGILITVAGAAWGFAAGTWFPGRFTAPLSAILFFLILFIPGAVGYPVENLSFFASSYDNEFWRIEPELTVLQIGLLLSLSGLATGFIVLKRQRDVPALALTGVAAVASLALAVILLGSERQTRVERVAYEPLCSAGSIEVCLHPAYRAVQDETVDAFERLTLPLVGVPGAPVRGEQVPSAAEWGLTPDGVIRFELNEAMTFLGGGNNSLMTHIAGVLAYGYACCDDAQKVIRAWLLQQAGVPIAICEEDCDEGGVCTGVPRRYVPYIERFAELEPEVRRAWLYDNYASLTRGELTLGDLP